MANGEKFNFAEHKFKPVPEKYTGEDANQEVITPGGHKTTKGNYANMVSRQKAYFEDPNNPEYHDIKAHYENKGMSHETAKRRFAVYMDQIDPQKVSWSHIIDYGDDPNEALWSYDQSIWADLTESFYNSAIINTAAGIAEFIPGTVTSIGNIFGFDAPDWAKSWVNGVEDWSEHASLRISDSAVQDMANGGAFSSWRAFAASFGQGLGSVVPAIAGGWLGAAGRGAALAGRAGTAAKIKRAATVGSATGAYFNMLPIVFRGAKDAGLSFEDAWSFANAVTPVVAMSEAIGLGYLAERTAAPISSMYGKQMITPALREVAEKGVTPETLASATRITTENVGGSMKKFVGLRAKGAVIKGAEGFGVEFIQEGSQAYIEAIGEQIYDTYFAGDEAVKGKGKFGADVMSKETLTRAFQEAVIGGLVGGGLSSSTSVFSPLTTESIYSLVADAKLKGKDHKIDDLKNYALYQARRGKITQEEAQKVNEFIDDISSVEDRIWFQQKNAHSRFQSYNGIKFRDQLNDLKSTIATERSQKDYPNLSQDTFGALNNVISHTTKVLEDTAKADEAQMISKDFESEANQLFKMFEKSNIDFDQSYFEKFKGAGVGADVAKDTVKLNKIEKDFKKGKISEEEYKTSTENVFKDIARKVGSMRAQHEADKAGVKVNVAPETSVITVQDEEGRDVTIEYPSDLDLNKEVDDYKSAMEEAGVDISDNTEVVTNNKSKDYIDARAEAIAEEYNDPSIKPMVKAALRRAVNPEISDKVLSKVKPEPSLKPEKLPVESGKKKVKKEVLAKNWSDLIYKAETEKELDDIMDQIDKVDESTPELIAELIDEIAKKRKYIRREDKSKRRTEEAKKREEKRKEKGKKVDEAEAKLIEKEKKKTESKAQRRAEEKPEAVDVEKELAYAERDLEQAVQEEEVFSVSKEGFIHDKFSGGGVRITPADFDAFGDPNMRKGNKAFSLKYLSGEASGIDGIAQEMSEEYGSEITEQDIIDYILDRELNPDKYSKKGRAEKIRMAEERLAAAEAEVEKTKPVVVKAPIEKPTPPPKQEKEVPEVQPEPEDNDAFGQLDLFSRGITDISTPIKSDIKAYQAVKDYLGSIYQGIFVKEYERLVDEYGVEVMALIGREGIKISNSASQQDIVHEYGHVYADILGLINPKLYKRGQELVKDTKYYDEARKVYSEKDAAKEAFIALMSEKGVDLINAKVQGDKFKTILQFLRTAWAKIKNFFGKASADDIARIAAFDAFVSQQPVKVGKNALQQTYYSRPARIRNIQNAVNVVNQIKYKMLVDKNAPITSYVRKSSANLANLVYFSIASQYAKMDKTRVSDYGISRSTAQKILDKHGDNKQGIALEFRAAMKATKNGSEFVKVIDEISKSLYKDPYMDVEEEMEEVEQLKASHEIKPTIKRFISTVFNKSGERIDNSSVAQFIAMAPLVGSNQNIIDTIKLMSEKSDIAYGLYNLIGNESYLKVSGNEDFLNNVISEMKSYSTSQHKGTVVLGDGSMISKRMNISSKVADNAESHYSNIIRTTKTKIRQGEIGVDTWEDDSYHIRSMFKNEPKMSQDDYTKKELSDFLTELFDIFSKYGIEFDVDFYTNELFDGKYTKRNVRGFVNKMFSGESIYGAEGEIKEKYSDAIEKARDPESDEDRVADVPFLGLIGTIVTEYDPDAEEASASPRVKKLREQAAKDKIFGNLRRQAENDLIKENSSIRGSFVNHNGDTVSSVSNMSWLPKYVKHIIAYAQDIETEFISKRLSSPFYKNNKVFSHLIDRANRGLVPIRQNSISNAQTGRVIEQNKYDVADHAIQSLFNFVSNTSSSEYDQSIGIMNDRDYSYLLSSPRYSTFESAAKSMKDIAKSQEIFLNDTLIPAIEGDKEAYMKELADYIQEISYSKLDYKIDGNKVTAKVTPLISGSEEKALKAIMDLEKDDINYVIDALKGSKRLDTIINHAKGIQSIRNNKALYSKKKVGDDVEEFLDPKKLIALAILNDSINRYQLNQVFTGEPLQFSKRGKSSANYIKRRGGFSSSYQDTTPDNKDVYVIQIEDLNVEGVPGDLSDSFSFFGTHLNDAVKGKIGGVSTPGNNHKDIVNFTDENGLSRYIKTSSLGVNESSFDSYGGMYSDIEAFIKEIEKDLTERGIENPQVFVHFASANKGFQGKSYSLDQVKEIAAGRNKEAIAEMTAAPMVVESLGIQFNINKEIKNDSDAALSVQVIKNIFDLVDDPSVISDFENDLVSLLEDGNVDKDGNLRINDIETLRNITDRMLGSGDNSPFVKNILSSIQESLTIDSKISSAEKATQSILSSEGYSSYADFMADYSILDEENKAIIEPVKIQIEDSIEESRRLVERKQELADIIGTDADGKLNPLKTIDHNNLRRIVQANISGVINRSLVRAKIDGAGLHQVPDLESDPRKMLKFSQSDDRGVVYSEIRVPEGFAGLGEYVISTRTPNSGYMSMFVGKVVGTTPAGENTIQVASEMIQYADWDFDADKLFTYRRPRPGNKKSDKENTIINRIIDTMVNRLSSKEAADGSKKQLEPSLEVNHTKEWIESNNLEGKFIPRNFDRSSDMKARNFVDEARSGRLISEGQKHIGIIAVWRKMLSVLSQSNDLLREGVEFGINTEIKDGVPSKEYGDMTDEVMYRSFSTEQIDAIGRTLQAALDSPVLLASKGINEHTVHVASLLAILGVSDAKIDLFLNRKEIVELSEHLYRTNNATGASTIQPKRVAISFSQKYDKNKVNVSNDVRGRLVGLGSDDRASFVLKGVDLKNIGKLKAGDSFVLQYGGSTVYNIVSRKGNRVVVENAGRATVDNDVLNKFLELKEIADKITANVSPVIQVDAGIPTNNSEINALLDIYKKGNEAKMPVTSKFMKRPLIQHYEKVLRYARRVNRRYFVSEGDVVSKAISDVKRSVGIIGAEVDNKIKNEFTKSIAQRLLRTNAGKTSPKELIQSVHDYTETIINEVDKANYADLAYDTEMLISTKKKEIKDQQERIKKEQALFNDPNSSERTKKYAVSNIEYAKKKIREAEEESQRLHDILKKEYTVNESIVRLHSNNKFIQNLDISTNEDGSVSSVRPSEHYSGIDYNSPMSEEIRNDFYKMSSEMQNKFYDYVLLTTGFENKIGSLSNMIPSREHENYIFSLADTSSKEWTEANKTNLIKNTVLSAINSDILVPTDIEERLSERQFLFEINETSINIQSYTGKGNEYVAFENLPQYLYSEDGTVYSKVEEGYEILLTPEETSNTRYISYSDEKPMVVSQPTTNSVRTDINDDGQLLLGFQEQEDDFKYLFSRISEDPESYNNIVAELQKLYPEIRILRDADIPEGKIGMAMRDAFNDLVAWSMTDGRLDTAPHEYAHVYIDWYRNHSLMQKALKKYGEERLATFMGQAFARAKAGKPMSKSFMKWLFDLWEDIRSVFGAPSVKRQIERAFTDGTRLQREKENTTMSKRYQAGSNIKGRITDYVGVDPLEDSTTHAGAIDVDSAYDIIHDEIASRFDRAIDNNTEEDSKGIALSNTVDYVINQVRKYHTVETKAGRQYSNIILEEYLQDMKYYVNNLGAEAKAKLFDEIAEGNVSEENEEFFGKMIKTVQALEYAETMQGKYIFDKDTLISRGVVESQVKGEIKTSLKGLDRAIAKLPASMRKFVSSMQKLSLQVLNPKYVAKNISGSFDSTVSQMFYKAFADGVGKQSEYYIGSTKIFQDAGLLKIKDINDWTAKDSMTTDKKAGKISDYKTTKIKIGDKSIEFIQDELLALYMNLTQKNSLEVIKERGFKLTDKIDGREEMKVTTLDDVDIAEIKSIVEGDPDMMKAVSAFREYFEYQHKLLNPVFKAINGFDMEKEDNYFPVHGAEHSVNLYTNESVVDTFGRGFGRVSDRKSPLGISGAMNVMKYSQDRSAIFYGYGIPVNNAKKMLNSDVFKEMRSDETRFPRGAEMAKYFESFVARVQNPSLMYPNITDRQVDTFLNRLMNNFSVAILGWNIPVMMKQPISYINAANTIDAKYLRKNSIGIPGHIFKSLAAGPRKGGQNPFKMIATWVDRNTAEMEEIRQHSPVLTARSLGYISREQGEIAQGRFLPFAAQKGAKVKLFGKIKFDKDRTMKGIQIFDTATILALWKSVKAETMDLYPELEVGSPEFYERVAARTEQVVFDTQPTYDMVHRSPLSASKNPVLRALTMFSSQPQKNLMQLINVTNDYVNQPTSQTRNRLARVYANILVKGALGIAMIDAIKAGILGYDDDDDRARAIFGRMMNTNMGMIPIVGQVYGGVVSRLDSQPWTQEAEHPAFREINNLSKSISDVISKSPEKSIPSLTTWYFEINGVPVSPMKQTIKLATPSE